MTDPLAVPASSPVEENKPTVSSEPASVAGEPVALVQGVHLVLGALVTLGWLNVNNATIDSLGTIIAIGLSVGAQLWARSRVKVVPKK